jgi:hypothetical protein
MHSVGFTTNEALLRCTNHYCAEYYKLDSAAVKWYKPKITQFLGTLHGFQCNTFFGVLDQFGNIKCVSNSKLKLNCGLSCTREYLWKEVKISGFRLQQLGDALPFARCAFIC